MSAIVIKSEWDETQRRIISETLCQGISAPQLDLFAQVCGRTGLDPFAKQIYATLRNTKVSEKVDGRWVDRWEKKMTIQTGIDGFRLIAERTKEYRGQDDFEWCGLDGKWVSVWLSNEPPAAARASVYRQGFEKAMRRVARFAAYCQTDSNGNLNSMWAKMHAEQLAKCAEALALRAAFPQELSGIYTNDEMAQADNAPEARSQVVEQPRTPPKQEAPNLPPPVDGPRFPSSWNRQIAGASHAGERMSEALVEVLTGFIHDIANSIDRASKPETKARCNELKAQAEAALEARIDAEAKTGDPSEEPLDGEGEVV